MPAITPILPFSSKLPRRIHRNTDKRKKLI
jgi:hypothetical protein